MCGRHHSSMLHQSFCPKILLILIIIIRWHSLMMTSMKKFGHTLMSPVLSPISIKMTTLLTCALHNMLPCLTPTSSPLPLYGYFVESKRWGEGKGPKLSIGSTIAFGGFIDRIQWEWNLDKAVLSMEIEIANIAYISNCPKNSPNCESSLS